MKYLVTVTVLLLVTACAPFGDSIVLMNRTTRAITDVEVKFKNDRGSYSVKKLAQLDARSQEKIAVSFKDISSGDGSYELTFKAQGMPYSMDFGYGPAASQTTVLLGEHFELLRSGQAQRASSATKSRELVMVTWVD
jgi:hypothetical protein